MNVKWIRRRMGVMGCTLSILAFTSVVHADTLPKNDPIRLGVGRDFPPYQFLDKGRPTGFDVELMDSIASIIGRDLEVKAGIWGEVVGAFHNGTLDVIPNSAEKVSTDFLYTLPICRMSYSIFVHKNSIHRKIDSVYSHSIAVQRGSTFHKYLISHMPPDSMILVDDDRQTLELLNQGKVNAAALPTMQGMFIIQNNKWDDIEPIKPEMYNVVHSYSLKKEDTVLLYEINEALNILKNNGKYDRLYDKWFGVYDSKISVKLLNKIIIVVAVMLVVLVISLTFVYFLRKLVHQRTEELRRNQMLLRNLIDTSPLWIAFYDKQGFIKVANRKFSTVFEKPLEEIEGAHFSEIVPTDLSINIEKRIEECSRGKTITFNDVIRLDGKPPIFTYGIYSPQYDMQGNVAGIIISVVDITERKLAEDRLKESESRFRSIFDQSPVAVMEEDFSELKARFVELAESGVTDFRAYFDEHPEEIHDLAAKVRILDVNQRSVELLGAANAGDIVRELPAYFKPDSFRVFKEEMIVLAEGSRTFRSEIPIVNNRGEHLILDLNLYVPLEFADSLARVLVSFLDVTGRKRAEEERAGLEEQLLQAQKMESVGRLAGGVAHDFNNMLGVILGNVELALLNIDPSESLYEDLEEVRKAAERSADLTRQLLAFARKQTIAPKVLDLNETIGSMLKMLKRLIGENIRLDWIPGEELWKIRIDPSQIDQILANLCVNSRDAISEVGTIRIQTGNAAFDDEYCAEHAEYEPGEFVVLTVSDDGRGMDEATLARVFEPFYTTKGLGEGTGLGLATVYGIVKQNEGFVTVNSHPDEGAVFNIYLPRYAETGSPQVMRTLHSARNADRGNETILLVEDEPSILKLTSNFLQRLGYTVIPASTPGEAMQLVESHPNGIQLLMTDVVMPEMNGGDLAKSIQTHYPDMKCLYMSGYPSDVIAHHGMLDENVHFIQKPFTMSSVAAKVREILKNDS